MRIIYERKYVAISIKHTEYKWKFGNPCVLWGYKRTKDDEERCFAGYTEDVKCAELYSAEEFIEQYGSDICKPEPVKMCVDFCKKYKKYDTVLVPEENYRAYAEVCGFGDFNFTI